VQGMSNPNLPIHKSQSSRSVVGLFGPFRTGSRVTGDFSAGDGEYVLSNNGFSHERDRVKRPLDRITNVSALSHSKTRRLQNHNCCVWTFRQARVSVAIWREYLIWNSSVM
jgi:hypothetical protein